MSSRHVAGIVSDSGEEEEEEVVTVKPTKTPKKRKAVISDDEQPPKKKKQQPQQQQQPEEAGRKKSPANSNKPSAEADDKAWQKAMELALTFLIPLKVSHEALTLLPDMGTHECFRKAAQAWLNERKTFVNLTYTTQKSFATMIGRFIFHFVLHACGLITTKWNPCGVVIWSHKCTAGSLKCLHGTAMISKEYIVEMDVGSENGQRALKENPERTKVTTNRWGRGIVQLKNDDAACCQHDAAMHSGNFSGKSCGLFFTESRKAVQAFGQISAFMKASYPKMDNAEERMLTLIQCECNWGIPKQLLGRQVCKMTPFQVNNLESYDPETIDNPRVLATVRNPSIMVFQCCNPVYRNSKATSQKNCDMKISAPDLVAALQLAKQMWSQYQSEKPSVVLQEFKWLPRYQYQTTILPTGEEDEDDVLF